MKKGLGLHLSRYFTSRRESFFFDFVKDELIKEIGAKTVRQGGLRVDTTIDLKKQQAAREAISGRLAGVGPSSAIVTIDPKNGYIKAMASSADYGKSKFNLAAQGHRQPGSTFKVMALMTALRKGVDPRSTTYVSKPLKFTDPAVGPDRRPDLRARLPRLDQPREGDAVLGQHGLRAAGARPRPAGGQADRLRHGHQDAPRRLPGGVARRPDDRRLPARDGRRLRDDRLRRLPQPADRDHQDHLSPTASRSSRSASSVKRTKAFSDGVTAEATRILEENVQAGTGTKAQIGCPAAGKTGTTDSFNDAWFVGFTPRLATAVWVGYPNAQIEMRTEYHGGSVAGGTFPAEIWHDYMTKVKGKFCGDFKPPKEPFHATPFFGKYSRSGGRGHRRERPAERRLAVLLADDADDAHDAHDARPGHPEEAGHRQRQRQRQRQGQVQPGSLRVAPAGRSHDPRQQAGRQRPGRRHGRAHRLTPGRPLV